MKNQDLAAITARIAKDMTAFANRLVPELEKYANNAKPDDAKAMRKALKDTKLDGIFKQLENEKRGLNNLLKKYK